MQDVKLDRHAIIETALELMREEGIDGFSMRKLGARLNIRAPTLYWYFPDRSSILRDIIGTLITDTVGAVPECASWQEWLQKFGEALWVTSREMPFVTMLLQSAELNDEQVFVLALDLIDRHLGKFGVDRTIYLGAHSDIQAFVLGWAVFEHSGITRRIQAMFDVETAVHDGIAAIISAWSAKADRLSPNGF